MAKFLNKIPRFLVVDGNTGPRDLRVTRLRRKLLQTLFDLKIMSENHVAPFVDLRADFSPCRSFGRASLTPIVRFQPRYRDFWAICWKKF